MRNLKRLLPALDYSTELGGPLVWDDCREFVLSLWIGQALFLFYDGDMVFFIVFLCYIEYNK